jgi:hypothetical protein
MQGKYRSSNGRTVHAVLTDLLQIVYIHRRIGDQQRHLEDPQRLSQHKASRSKHKTLSQASLGHTRLDTTGHRAQDTATAQQNSARILLVLCHLDVKVPRPSPGGI